MYREFVEFVRQLYGTEAFIPLHAPVFSGREKQYVCDAIDTTFVSSVSDYVDRFEQDLCELTGAKYAVSVMNGTAALHLALHALGVDEKSEVITQSLTFVATCNAIAYTGADPVFVDVERSTLGMSPESLRDFLENHGELSDQGTINRETGRRIAACLPMHTFGHPARIDEIDQICRGWKIPVVEDAAEAIGSTYKNRHCGTFSTLGALSFNGNKIITTGGGGAILTDDQVMAQKLKHLSTTARKKHSWKYIHDQIGFNYRLPGLNAALGCAQLECLDDMLRDKREITRTYQSWADQHDVELVCEPEHAHSNYWLNALMLSDQQQRDEFLEYTNERGVMTRPLWEPMHQLEGFTRCQYDDLSVTEEMAARVVNIPSSPRMEGP